MDMYKDLKGWRWWVWMAVNVAAIVIAMVFACGCSRKVYVPVESVECRIDTDSLNHLIRDFMSRNERQREKETVYVYEKKSVTLNEAGDTVRSDTERMTDRTHELESIVENQRHVIDSLLRQSARIDSIRVPVPYPVEKTVEVERKRKWWEIALLWCGGVAYLVLCIALICRKPIIPF